MRLLLWRLDIELCVALRPRLRRAVQAGLPGRLPFDDDRPGQAAALVVAAARAVPVVARAVEVEGGCSLRVVHQPDELRLTIVRQNRAMRVLVVVDERELQLSLV